MIRVELVGGAKKSFSKNVIEIDIDSTTVGEMLGILDSMRLDGSPAIDSKNTLVAVNGADTSATGGLSSAVRRGDTISIIPIIHGGSDNSDMRQQRLRIDVGRRHFDLACVRPGRQAGPEFLDGLRARYPQLRIQAVSSRYVLGASHVRRIIEISAESERRNIMLANKIETDILMRFALSKQISAAIKSVGMRPSARGSFLLVSTGPAKSLDSLHGYIGAYLSELFDCDNAAFLKRTFGISKKQTCAVSSESPLEDILVEKAAILGADVAVPLS